MKDKVKKYKNKEFVENHPIKRARERYGLLLGFGDLSSIQNIVKSGNGKCKKFKDIFNTEEGDVFELIYCNKKISPVIYEGRIRTFFTEKMVINMRENWYRMKGSLED